MALENHFRRVDDIDGAKNRQRERADRHRHPGVSMVLRRSTRVPRRVTLQSRGAANGL